MISTEAQRFATAGDWLLRLQADELDQQELAAWLDWYGAAPENAAAFEALQSQFEGLRAAPEAWRRALADKLLPRVSVAPAKRRSFKWRRLAIAACLIAAAIGTVFILRSGSVWNAARPLETAVYQSPRATHQKLRLPDGSQVALGALSTISLNFSSEARYLVLEGGEAFFEVARDARRPFVVQAGPVTVRALGTSFNVRRADEQVMVAVSEGVVEVKRRRTAHADSAVRVSAGEQVSVNSALTTPSVTVANPQAVTAWQRGRLEFVNEPLSSVVSTVNRYSSREIVVTDAELAATSYTGTVNEDRIEEWLTALPDVFPVRVSHVGGETILLSVQK